MQEGGGLDDENSVNSIFDVVRNEYSDVKIVNYTYTRTVANRDMLNPEDIGSFTILVDLFEHKLKQLMGRSSNADNHVDNYLIGGTFSLLFLYFFFTI